MALDVIARSLRHVCQAARTPAAEADAHWVLTGEPAPAPRVEEAVLIEEVLSARIAVAAAGAAWVVVPLEGEWRQGLARLDAWARRPEIDEGAVPSWTPTLSREEVLAAIRPEAHDAVARMLDGARAAWLTAEQRRARIEGVAAPQVSAWRLALWQTYRDGWFRVPAAGAGCPAEEIDEGSELATPLADEMLCTERGAVMLACCAALHSATGYFPYRPAIELALRAATAAAGEPAVRAAIVRDVGPWLLREEP